MNRILCHSSTLLRHNTKFHSSLHLTSSSSSSSLKKCNSIIRLNVSSNSSKSSLSLLSLSTKTHYYHSNPIFRTFSSIRPTRPDNSNYSSSQNQNENENENENENNSNYKSPSSTNSQRLKPSNIYQPIYKFKNALLTWGNSSLGGHGSGTGTKKTIPSIPSTDLYDQQFISSSSGWCGSAAISTTGLIYEWGMKLDMRVFVSEVKRATRWPRYHAFLCKIGLSPTEIDTPTQIIKLLEHEDDNEDYHPNAYNTTVIVPADSVQFIASATGGDFHLFLSSTGSVYSKGSGFYGQLGHTSYIPHTYLQTNAKRIEFFHRMNITITQVAAGMQHSLFLTDNGNVFVCGKTDSGATGLDFDEKEKRKILNPDDDEDEDDDDDSRNNQPELKSSKNSHRYVSGPRLFLPQIIPETSVKVCEQIRQERDNDIKTDAKYVRRKKNFIGKIVQIAAGARHSVLLNEKGQVYTMGKNLLGECGIFIAPANPKSASRSSPVYFPPIEAPMIVSTLPVDDPIVQISSGQHHVLCLAKSGVIYSWGFGRQGQCGQPVSYATHNLNDENREKRKVIGSILKPAVMTQYDEREMGKCYKVVGGFYDTVMMCTKGNFMIGGNCNQLQNLIEPAKILPQANLKHISFGYENATAIADTPASHTPFADQIEDEDTK